MIDPRPMLALVLVAASASAGEVSHQRALELRQSGELIPFAEIVAIVEARYPGLSMLEVELEEDDNRYIYELEILTPNGQVRELEVDARRGDILDDELED